MTNMGLVIPSRDRTLKQIFKDKVAGTDHDLVSAELIAYLKWLIYVAAYEDRSQVDHVKFYNDELIFLQHPNNRQWRGRLYIALEEWYSEHPPTKKRRSNIGGAERPTAYNMNRPFLNIDDFVDPLADNAAAAIPPSASSAAAAAALAAAAAASGGAAGAGALA